MIRALAIALVLVPTLARAAQTCDAAGIGDLPVSSVPGFMIARDCENLPPGTPTCIGLMFTYDARAQSLGMYGPRADQPEAFIPDCPVPWHHIPDGEIFGIHWMVYQWSYGPIRRNWECQP